MTAQPLGLTLAGIPESHTRVLLETYNAVLRNHREHRWEPAELNGGKFAEVVYAILAGHVAGTFDAVPTKPKNMVVACSALEQADMARFSRSLRIQIPRMLLALYEIRNNRNVGHIGGDVDPSLMDATAVLSMTQWIMAELVRSFDPMPPAQLQSVVDAIVERRLPVIWEVDAVRRVLRTDLTLKQHLMLLLYTVAGKVADTDVARWMEHSSVAILRRDVIVPCHKARLLEYDRQAGAL